MSRFSKVLIAVIIGLTPFAASGCTPVTVTCTTGPGSVTCTG